MTKRKLNNKIKKIRVSSKRVFYIRFRPVAQKWFFPIVLVIFSVACIDHWYSNRGTWVFENVSAAVFEETNLIETAQPVSGGLGVNGTMANTTASVAVPTGGTQVSSVSGSVIEVIKPIANKYGIDWKILAAICLKESRCNADRVGDNGWSFGYYQIHQKYHPNTIKCAKDLECATEWTAKRLKRHESLGTWEMVRSHNGLVANNANAYYVEDVKTIMQSL
jgi:hypothetical protein